MYNWYVPIAIGTKNGYNGYA